MGDFELNIKNLPFFSTLDITKKYIFPFHLRYLLFCDQCHDFLESNDRNQWKGVTQKKKVYEKLCESFLEDIEWLKLQFGYVYTTFRQYINAYLTLIKIDNLQNSYTDYSNTSKIIEKIDYLNLHFFNIIQYKMQIESSLCSNNYNAIIEGLQLNNYSKYNLTIDADYDKFSFASLLYSICDETSRPRLKPYDKYTIINTVATLYDSASGSKVISHLKHMLNAVNVKLSERTHIVNNGESYIYTLKFDNIELLKFRYFKRTDRKRSMIAMRGSSLDISDIYLQIYQVYNKNFPIFNTFKKSDSSVNKITSTYPVDSDYLKHVVWFKTLGDFGQIISFYQYNSVTINNSIGLFITFDKICSRISLFFNYTLFESADKKNVRSPIITWVRFFRDNNLIKLLPIINSKDNYPTLRSYNIP
jgi:hypothetical protein